MFVVCLPASILFLFTCVCVCVSMSVCHVLMSICGLQNRVPDLLELELLTVMSIWHHYWELNSSSLEEQYTLLTAESFIHPLLFLIRIFSLKLELSLIQCALISIFFYYIWKTFPNKVRFWSSRGTQIWAGSNLCTLLPQDWAILLIFLLFCILKMKYINL